MQKKKNSRRLKKSLRLLSALLFFFCFCSFPALLPAQESEDAFIQTPREGDIQISRESWSGFLKDWMTLRQGFERLEIQHRNLKEHYDLLFPKLETLEKTLTRSEEASRILKEQTAASGTRLTELNGSLKRQISQTASLERKVRLYKTAFFISIGAGIAGTGIGVLFAILK